VLRQRGGDAVFGVHQLGGVVAFIDFVEGNAGLSAPEEERFLKFMKVPRLLNLANNRALLEGQQCEVLDAVDTKWFSLCKDLYLTMLKLHFV
jgi:hypothetical protein